MKELQTVIGSDIKIAREFLERGDIIGIPTETVYGLAGNALNADAVLKIFAVKNRPHFDPLIVHTFATGEIKKYVTNIPPKAGLLINVFMPGPLTVLLSKKPVIPDIVTSGLETVAIRVPQHPLVVELLKSLHYPLAAPSANPFGYISPTTARHVFDQLHGKISYILDGGPSNIGVESTIIGFENERVIVFRPGGLSIEEIEKVVGKVEVRATLSGKAKNPGMFASHYSPKKKLVFGTGEFIEREIVRLIKDQKPAVICFDRYLTGVSHHHQILLSQQGDLNEAAKNLFSAMRKADDGEADIIFAVEFPHKGLGRAINDRLKRASA